MKPLPTLTSSSSTSHPSQSSSVISSESLVSSSGIRLEANGGTGTACADRAAPGGDGVAVGISSCSSSQRTSFISPGSVQQQQHQQQPQHALLPSGNHASSSSISSQLPPTHLQPANDSSAESRIRSQSNDSRPSASANTTDGTSHRTTTTTTTTTTYRTPSNHVWSVPNPLASLSAASSSVTNTKTTSHLPTPSPLPPPNPSPPTTHTQQPHQHLQQPQKQQHVTQHVTQHFQTTTPSSSSHPSPQSIKRKLTLSSHAKALLTRAVLSALRSPDGKIDPQAMEQVVSIGIPPQMVIHAAGAARERERRKRLQNQQQRQRQAQQQQHQQQQQQQQQRQLQQQQQRQLQQQQQVQQQQVRQQVVGGRSVISDINQLIRERRQTHTTPTTTAPTPSPTPSAVAVAAAIAANASSSTRGVMIPTTTGGAVPAVANHGQVNQAIDHRRGVRTSGMMSGGYVRGSGGAATSSTVNNPLKNSRLDTLSFVSANTASPLSAPPVPAYIPQKLPQSQLQASSYTSSDFLTNTIPSLPSIQHTNSGSSSSGDTSSMYINHAMRQNEIVRNPTHRSPSMSPRASAPSITANPLKNMSSVPHAPTTTSVTSSGIPSSSSSSSSSSSRYPSMNMGNASLGSHSKEAAFAQKLKAHGLSSKGMMPTANPLAMSTNNPATNRDMKMSSHTASTPSSTNPIRHSVPAVKHPHSTHLKAPHIQSGSSTALHRTGTSHLPNPQAPNPPHNNTTASPRPTAASFKPPTNTSSRSSSSNTKTKAVRYGPKTHHKHQWKRITCGLYITQQQQPNSSSSTIRSVFNGTVVKSRNITSALLPGSTPQNHPAPLPPSISTASSPLSFLHDPEQYKRVKVQPRKDAKLIEKQIRKSLTLSSETLLRRYKFLLKSIVNHQAEFFKHHRLRKQKIHHFNKSFLTHVEKLSKKKKRDENQAERARLAALKANDMTAYSSLLEETKNERLKFLLDKTDEYMAEISKSLRKERMNDDASSDEEPITTSFTPTKTDTDYYASAHITEEDVRQPSILIGGDLKNYQLSGLQWLVSLYNNRLNGILADEMGLGKTIQTISLLAYLIEVKDNRGPFLVIVPLSTLSNWVNEFAKWCPAVRVITYKGTPAVRKDLFRSDVATGHFNVLLTTYEYIIKDKLSLRKITWQYAIVDEGHRMKNAKSKFAVVLGSQYTTLHRVLLTGTPLQNNLPELWSLLNFLLPTIFNSVDTFDQWFNRPFAQFGGMRGGGGGGKGEGDDDDSDSGSHVDGNGDPSDQLLSNEERLLIIARLHELLRPFMLRRVKSEVLDQLPEKVEKVLRCELSSWQKALYRQISASATDNENNGIDPDERKKYYGRGLNNIIMQLRKVCNHPYLFSPNGYHINSHIIRSSGKVELLDRMLPKLKATGHRILMFFQMTAVMTILEDYLSYRGHACLRLDGSTPAEEREKRMYMFNAPDSPYFVFLLSTRAGGLGLNLTAADTVIIFDSDWNPMMDLQAQDRAHRIGQRNEVRVFRLVTYSPVEEKILSRATEKLNMSEIVVEAGKFDQEGEREEDGEERRKMMELLLTDFDTGGVGAGSTSVEEGEESQDTDENNREKDSMEEMEVFNELLSGNVMDYEVFCKIDEERRNSQEDCGLFVEEEDVPDWIRYPGKKNDKTSNDGENATAVTATASETSKRRNGKKNPIVYDDGLTEFQFVKMVEKTAQEEEDASKARKQGKPPTANSTGTTGTAIAASGSKRKKSNVRKRSSSISSQQQSLPKRTTSRKRKTPPSSSKSVVEIGNAHLSSSAIPNKTNDQNDDQSTNSSIIDVGTYSPDEHTANNTDDNSTTQQHYSPEPSPANPPPSPPPTTISDPITKKLISTTKSLINLREPSTKRRISEIFLEKPCREMYPDYYEIIERPIAINDILRALGEREYKNVFEFWEDWDCLFSNARRYNADGSWVVVDAGTLESELYRLMDKNGLSAEFPPPSSTKPLRIKLSLKGGPTDDTSSLDENSGAQQQPTRSKKKKKKKKKKRPRSSSAAGTSTVTTPTKKKKKQKTSSSSSSKKRGTTPKKKPPPQPTHHPHHTSDNHDSDSSSSLSSAHSSSSASLSHSLPHHDPPDEPHAAAATVDIYSDVVGMEQRTITKKRSSSSSRRGGSGSSGGKGAYQKSKKKKKA